MERYNKFGLPVCTKLPPTRQPKPKQQRETITMSTADAPDAETSANDLKSGPFSLLYNAVRGNTQVLVNVRNNHKLLGRVKAYDRHMNLYVKMYGIRFCAKVFSYTHTLSCFDDRLLEDVKEMWTEQSKGGKGKTRGMAINKDRYVSKMFLRGDSVILIVSNPAALAGAAEK